MNADESKTKLVQDLHFSDEKIAKLEIFVNEDNYNLMEGLDLAEYFITSKATKKRNDEDDIRIIVKKSTGTKCPRCWKILQGKCIRCDQAAKSIKK